MGDSTVTEPCMWCGAPSTRLCDAVIGYEATSCARTRAGGVEALLTGLGGDVWTCDAPICDAHARQVGFVTGKTPDSIDYCPHHAALDRPEMAELVMFHDEAVKTRSDLYAAIRRQRMRESLLNPQIQQKGADDGPRK